MRNLILKYLAFLLIGIAIGIYGFGDYRQREISDIEKLAPARAQEREIPRVIEESRGGSNEHYLEIIREQDEEIAILKAEVSRMKVFAEKSDTNDSKNGSVETISLEEMASNVGLSLRNQFRTQVLTMPDEQMEEVKQSFYDEPYSSWGMEYQDRILNFFGTGDNEGQYHLQSIECKTKACRLEVTTENESGWREFYFSMTHQDWYESFTLQGESDYPGTVVYYLLRDEDDGD